jgi:hypothetical protein
MLEKHICNVVIFEKKIKNDKYRHSMALLLFSDWPLLKRPLAAFFLLYRIEISSSRARRW